ncbi:sn-glycerol-3-phosphate ABC transporter ATP-binding protein UgpC [Paucibacter sp. R3-3]|uniref:Sn-glycerol-3-phosphate ABC transporter ATP-binding protein UgpC n=1 Tax=Roseateles agri TaxID=3098619 RepID=A0ABU5DG42_9BURK|nr:sn-glycerol-3-phosphate ABC transporter ATP-binding protein UgpC [Paucibacter sp. R3-3]MDY0745255.1 sn-glycerol-3-phosphate ABC transporter ATP-binding protein UgpC [Paucibacter sp. R3-3]
MADVTLTEVRKSFGSTDVIRGVSLDIKHGEFVVFVGPSGCGKSTLLRAISGLEEISSGELRIGGQLMNHVDPSKRGIAMVFQSYALYPHMTVRENMGFALKHAGEPKAQVAEKVERAAAILGLQPLMDRKPKALSGGQRQRVAIGRAIVRDPEVFLFDEPLSNLDAELRVHMRIEVARLHRELGSTIIYVTHDQVEAMTLADKIVVLRAGVVEQVGAPLELYDNPANTFVAGFIGSPRMNFFEGRVVGHNEGRLHIALSGFGDTVIALPLTHELPAIGTEVSVGVRPEHFQDDGDATLPVTIDMLEHLGGETFAYARSAGGAMAVIELKHGRHLRAGQALEVRFDTGKSLLFGKDGRRLYCR